MTLFDVPSIILSTFIVTVALSTAIYLFMKRKHFPYSNISPVWVIITLISKNILK